MRSSLNWTVDMRKPISQESRKYFRFMIFVIVGASSFPDGVFRAGNLTPIYEETESDLDLYKKGIELPLKLNKCIDSSVDDISDTSMNDSLECEMDSSMNESDESECDHVDGFVSSCDDSDGENEQITVNGKIINTYGRELNPTVEEDFDRCPQLDKLLANISDSESELPFSKNTTINSSNAGTSLNTVCSFDLTFNNHLTFSPPNIYFLFI